MTTVQTPGWTGHIAVDSALIMLDRVDCSPDDDARIDAITATLHQLHAAYQALQTENERLRMELVAEASAAAEQKLRADQLAQQHRMQAQMHAQATQQLAELEARKPLPPIAAIKLGMEAQQACRPHSTGTTNWAAAMTRFYERRLTSTTTGGHMTYAQIAPSPSEP